MLRSSCWFCVLSEINVGDFHFQIHCSYIYLWAVSSVKGVVTFRHLWAWLLQHWLPDYLTLEVLQNFLESVHSETNMEIEWLNWKSNVISHRSWCSPCEISMLVSNWTGLKVLKFKLERLCCICDFDIDISEMTWSLIQMVGCVVCLEIILIFQKYKSNLTMTWVISIGCIEIWLWTLKQPPTGRDCFVHMCPANERWRYSVTPSLIGWAHTQNDPCYGHRRWALDVCRENFERTNWLRHINVLLYSLISRVHWIDVPVSLCRVKSR